MNTYFEKMGIELIYRPDTARMSILCTSISYTKQCFPLLELVRNLGIETLHADKSRYSKTLLSPPAPTEAIAPRLPTMASSLSACSLKENSCKVNYKL